jgi:hypothetical protein
VGKGMIFDTAHRAYMFAKKEVESLSAKQIYVTCKDGKYHANDIGWLPDGIKDFRVNMNKKCPTKGCKNKAATTYFVKMLDEEGNPMLEFKSIKDSMLGIGGKITDLDRRGENKNTNFGTAYCNTCLQDRKNS